MSVGSLQLLVGDLHLGQLLRLVELVLSFALEVADALEDAALGAVLRVHAAARQALAAALGVLGLLRASGLLVGGRRIAHLRGVVGGEEVGHD